jgi:hypothetical protein
MTRVAVALAVVVALAAGVWWFWPEGEHPSSGATTSTIVVTTTTPTVGSDPVSTTTPGAGPTTTDVAITVEEAEEILRDLWFGWFEGIYDQDEDRIREVVVSEEQVEVARSQFGAAHFTRPPRSSDIAFEDVEILLADEACLAVWARILLTGFRDGVSEGVTVLQWRAGHWARRSIWQYRNDLWIEDCPSG